MAADGSTPRPRKPRPPRTNGVEPVAAAITAALKLRGISEEIRANRVVTEWTSLVGKRIADRTRADGIKERTLWIEVSSSAWMHELNLIRPQLHRDLTARLGQPRLFDDLKFRLAGRTKDTTGRTPTVVRHSAAPIPARIPIPATGAARDQIAADVARIDDPDLRELIARVRIKYDK